MQQELAANFPHHSSASNTQEELDFSLSGYDYDLPPELIAQNPVVPRDSSRLLVVDSRKIGVDAPAKHRIFRDLAEILQPGDLLVMNNTRVLPARMYGQKSTGAEIEVLLLEERQENCWLALVKPGKRFKQGTELRFTAQGTDICLTAKVVDSDEATGGRLLEFTVPEGKSLIQLLDVFGEVPLPPYITETTAASAQYQTVYAENPGAIAAPTAGLHFTPELLERLRSQNIHQAFITLHVGVGTFRPVEVEDVTTHQMHAEWIEVPATTVEQIRATQAAGGRIIAVGTTAVRALEGAAAAHGGTIQPFCGKTNLFIYPGFKWQVVEGLITNFHLPRSSLLMLVSALIGRTRLLQIYQEAIQEKYRFYSFGDAMLILPSGILNNGE
ncbi:tRNA preQ1(34) S-adenosylmethionine ribosyltransferase-isomerase QueA [Calothrix sp. 336/3]|uniref:tRNA preQ1(34) S-adenosylmethionine ribosyltransferase-isomerase QueA n=1 Tax=Calothrix sp. 336/3 TaxID=1337936 RepID=UPI0004E3A3D8|nr:tRNA preQ1(34) S-adenosylmethionine ribosyltransferase-isomerase QueA [Calothrix sp. 336/3]AKG21712.1 S-adenosylmethionine tRNA ribosyltransferase [Calothrix sp. 336/3]